jgi:hypothetical protein
MNESFGEFLQLPEQERRDVFEATARHLDTLASNIEKDLWVCLVLDGLYNGLPDGHPRLLFKGGTSLSKAFGLIRRFSEDIDIVVYRDDLGFGTDRDPDNPDLALSGKKRRALFEELRAACGDYICGRLRDELEAVLARVHRNCRVTVDEDDSDGQTILVEYPSLYDGGDAPYVAPRVKIEGGARSAFEPNESCRVTPYIADALDGFDLNVANITAIVPARTLLEKILILHGAHCGYRDQSRVPTDRQRISRHYYDVAMLAGSDAGRAALKDRALLDAVRAHNLVAFPQAWKKFDEAVPGTTRLVPQADLRVAIERDYAAMQGMVFGEVPDFDWIMDRLRDAETDLNTIE